MLPVMDEPRLIEPFNGGECDGVDGLPLSCIDPAGCTVGGTVQTVWRCDELITICPQLFQAVLPGIRNESVSHMHVWEHCSGSCGCEDALSSAVVGECEDALSSAVVGECVQVLAFFYLLCALLVGESGSATSNVNILI
jgi:hypothetical protein